ncbi:MAG: alpha/beta hydrolase family protein, partial [Anaerolineae bacterium]
YLCTRKDVDPERIGCTGCSGGGNQTMYVSALDERIKAAVPVCSVEPISDYMEKGFCTCEAIPGEVRLADLIEITGLIAPRALLLVHGILDSGFPILSARMAASRIREIYRLYEPERFATFESYAEHDYNAEMRRAMYAWFDRWLMGHESSGEEEEPGEANLQVLTQGLPAGYASLASIFASRLATLPPVPEPEDGQAWQARRQALGLRLHDILGEFPLPDDLDIRPVAVDEREGYRRERFWFRSEPDILIPAVFLAPRSAGPHDTVLYVLAGGKAALAEEEAMSHLKRGQAVLAFDARGTGETSYSRETAFLSAFALGRPLLAMHVWDTIRCLDYLGQRADVGRIHVIGKGSLAAAMTALLAAALNNQATSLAVDALPATLRLPIEDRAMDELYLANILKVTDICEIAAMVAPRPLEIGTLLGDGLQPLSPSDASHAFRSTLRVYDLLSAATAIKLPQ